MPAASHEEAFEAAGHSGIRSGYPTLDAALDVIVRGELCLIAGPAFGGKSTLALNIALNNAGTKIFWSSPDESHPFVVKKLVSAWFDVALKDVNEWRTSHTREIREFLVDLEDWFYCSEEAHPDQIQKDLIEANAKFGQHPDLFIFDYVRLLDAGFQSSIHASLSWLKKLAKSSGMHVVAIHQANKSALAVNFDRNGHPYPPTMADLNEAGHAEAFQIMWVRRPPTDNEADALRAEQYPSTQIWLIKNKIQPSLPTQPITLSVSRGGRLVER